MIQRKHWVSICAFFTAAFVATTGHGADSNDTMGEYGPTPELPAPEKSLLPTVNIAKAVPWQGGAMPRSAAGLRVSALERGLQQGNVTREVCKEK